MTSPKTSDFGYDDPTQYDHRADANAAAYSEIAALGLSAGFLSASLTLHLVRADGLAATTPTVVVPESPMTVVPEGPVVQSDSTTVTAAPTGASRGPGHQLGHHRAAASYDDDQPVGAAGGSNPR